MISHENRQSYPSDLTDKEWEKLQVHLPAPSHRGRPLEYTFGLVLLAVVPVASVQDREGAKQAFQAIRSRFPRLKLIWADGGYAGKLVNWVKARCNWVLEIVKRSDDMKGFQVLPRRWVVERTFGWLSTYRRLRKDYEQLPETSESFVYVAMIHIMTRRLAGTCTDRAP